MSSIPEALPVNSPGQNGAPMALRPSSQGLSAQLHRKAPSESFLAWIESHRQVLLRCSLALVFLWFGALKPLGLSPAEGLVAKTVFWLPAWIFVPVLGIWEVAIGVGLLYRPWLKAAIVLLLLQMAGTLLPLVILPSDCFARIPFAPTLEGQYIIKNVVLITAALVVAAEGAGRRW